jgi:hypothetical protein
VGETHGLEFLHLRRCRVANNAGGGLGFTVVLPRKMYTDPIMALSS